MEPSPARLTFAMCADRWWPTRLEVAAATQRAIDLDSTQHLLFTLTVQITNPSARKVLRQLEEISLEKGWRRRFDSVPDHHVFKHLQTLHSEFWFQLVPIPAADIVSCGAPSDVRSPATNSHVQVVR